MNVARDVILAQAEDGTLHCSAFAVSFKPVSTLYKWLVSRPALSRLHALRGGGTIPPSAAAPGQEEGPSDAGDGPANTLAASILSSIGLSPNPPPTPSSASSAASRPALRGSTENVVETSSPVVPSPTDDSSLSQPQPPPTHPHRREGVEVYVRGQLVPGLEMVVDEKGACVFVSTGTTHPSPTSLQTLAAGGLLEPGINPVEFVYCNPYGDVSVQASFHLWGVHDRLVVSDIDGTVTKSDVRGYVHSVHLGDHEYTHQGIAPLFSHLHRAHHLRFVYLTSRPSSLLEATRAYIANVDQEGGHKLPQGPIFTSSDSLTRVLYKELVEKTIRYYKAQTLNDLVSLFTRAGRREGDHLFLFGFGNKEADGQAYEMVSIDPLNIFLINPSSEVRVFASYKESALGGGERGKGGRVARVFEWRRQLSPDVVESPPPVAAAAAAAATGAGGEKEEEEGMDEEREGPVRRATPVEREDSTTYVYSSYCDARLLQVLERRLACHQRMRRGEEEEEERVGV